MSDERYRTERDSMGELQVPEDAMWGAQTQRAVNNFPISALAMPPLFIQTLGLVKWAAAAANNHLGLLDDPLTEAIQHAAREVAEGVHLEQFPIDVFQTGSGTSSNMNANEVVARLASLHSGLAVHPNDHVNMCQSSNDVIPTCIHVSAAMSVKESLLPAMHHLYQVIRNKAAELDGHVKTGRTHLMDAMPVRMSQEAGGWAQQIKSGIDRVESVLPRLECIAQGGTAVGTGINAHEDFGKEFAAILARTTGIPFRPSPDYFEAMSCQDTAVELSGQLRTLAVSLMKICNDLRWMNSGPLAGIGEIALPALQPGSSIMPGKVNPVIPEAVCMVAAQVIGSDAAIAVAGQSGNFQLNVALPVIAHNLLQSLEILSSSCRVLADSAVAGFTVNETRLAAALERNPILVTALNPVIGYELGATTAKRAYAEGRPIREVARETTDLGDDDLERLLDPAALTHGGIKK